MQKHVVIARFDAQTDQTFISWKEKSNALQHRLYTNASAWTAQFAQEQCEVPVQFPSLGVFAHGAAMETDVIYAAPANSVDLMRFYYGFHERLDDFCGDYGRIYTAEWGFPVFHATLTICQKQDFDPVFGMLRDVFRPIAGRITALEVYENPMKLVAGYALKPTQLHEKHV